MPRVLRDSRIVYSALLFVYPREFRRRFGSEMLGTFSDQLSDEWAQNGAVGLLRVWRSAVSELFSVAVPLQIRNPTTTAMALSFLVSSAVFMAILRAVSIECSK
jgi:hypothetical protein